MKLRIALLSVLALLCAANLFAQGGRYDTWAVDSTNHFVASPTVRVCTYSAPWSSTTAYVTGNTVTYNGGFYTALASSTNVTPGTDPTKWQSGNCSPLASIYADKSLATAQANPFIGDAFGNYGFYAAAGSYIAQVNGYVYPVVVGATAAGNNPFTGTNSFKNHDGVRSCAQFASLQACLDDAGNDGSVYFPEGTYTYSTALHPYRGQNWQCGGGDAKSQGGVIFNYTGTGWAAENANKATTILEFWKMKGNCTFQVTSSATGAVDLKSVDHADLDYFVTAPLTGSVIGVNFDGAIASYYNKVTMRMFGTDGSNYAANNSHKCVVMSNGANENQVYGTCTGIDYGFDIQSANNSRFDMTVDGWGTRCINLGNSAGVHHNLFLHNRCETYAASIVGKTSPAAVQFGAASTDNKVFYPFESLPTGATGVQDDSAGTNDIEGVLVTPASPVGNFYGYSFGKHSSGLRSRFAINKVPTNAFDLDVAGAVNVDGAFTVGGDINLKRTTDGIINFFLQAGATANQQRNLIWRDFNSANVFGWLVGTANNSIQLFDYTSTSQISRFTAFTNNSTNINSASTASVFFNKDTNSGTGGVQFWSGGASPAQVATISSAGKGTFNSGIAVESTGNVTIKSGTGAPSAGACTASTLGALYLNVSGGTSTTFYVCTAAGTWTAK